MGRVVTSLPEDFRRNAVIFLEDLAEIAFILESAADRDLLDGAKLGLKDPDGGTKPQFGQELGWRDSVKMMEQA